MAVSPRDLERTVPPPLATRPIAVGIDGSTSSLVAAEWAATEAARLGCSVQLVHAYPADVFEYPVTPIGRERAELAFDAAKQRLGTPRYDGLQITTYASQGSAVRVLRRVSREARMLVLGHEHAGRMASMLSTSTAVACAAHVTVPVTVVPSIWEAPVSRYGLVVVGVDGSDRCQAAAGYAFGMADELGARLLVVSALDLPSGYPQGWPVGAERIRLEGEARRGLEDTVARWQPMFPDVHVDVVVDERSAVESLVDSSTQADRIVIGGRGHGLVTGALVGSVARSVLRDARGPVTVVHPMVEGLAS